MKKEDNLIPYTSDQNREEAKKNGRKGGVASGKARREKKSLKELALSLLNNELQNDELKARILNIFPDAKGEDMQIQTAMVVAQISKALKGDSKAFEVLRDTSGQKPIEKQEIGFAGNEKVEIKIDGEDVE